MSSLYRPELRAAEGRDVMIAALDAKQATARRRPWSREPSKGPATGELVPAVCPSGPGRVTGGRL
jgi:hypothetical protein